MIIRSGRTSDLEMVMELEHAGFPAGDRWSPESWRAELAGTDRTVLVALDPPADATTPVAGVLPAAALGVITCQTVAETADLLRVVVAPAARRRRVGRALVQAAMMGVRRRRASAMLLEVEADNHPALGLYRGCGFETIHTRRGYYGPGRDAMIMRRAIEADLPTLHAPPVMGARGEAAGQPQHADHSPLEETS